MASPGIVSTDPATAISQLWEGLPGEYVVTPRFHGEFSINDSIVSADDFVTPSLGRSKIISRPPSKAGYQSEFLETSTTTLVTKTGEEITMTERRIFRSRKDRGSVWAVAKDGQVTSLIADLYLTREISGPTGFRAFGPYFDDGVPAVWLGGDSERLPVHLSVEFLTGDSPRWQVCHRLREGTSFERVLKMDEYVRESEGSMV